MRKSPPLVREFYIIFQESGCWWKYLLKPNFSHVLLLINDGFNWILIDPAINTMSIKILPILPDMGIDMAIKDELILEDCSIVKLITHTYTSIYFAPKVRFLTCTLLIRYLIGVQLPGFTPYGMFKNLLKAIKDPKKRKFGRNEIIDVELIKTSI